MIMKKLSIYYSDDKWYVKDDDWTTKVSWKKENKKKKKSSIKMIKKVCKKTNRDRFTGLCKEKK